MATLTMRKALCLFWRVEKAKEAFSIVLAVRAKKESTVVVSFSFLFLKNILAAKLPIYNLKGF